MIIALRTFMCLPQSRPNVFTLKYSSVKPPCTAKTKSPCTGLFLTLLFILNNASAMNTSEDNKNGMTKWGIYTKHVSK